MAHAIARMRYLRNLTQNDVPSNSQVQRSMYYYGYGKPATRLTGETRGVWYDQNGDVRPYGAALAWAKGTALHNKYTYTLLLSVKDIRPTPEAFVSVMQQSVPPFSHWRLIAHDDTAYAHAHVIAFSDRILPKREVVGWSSRAREALETLRLEQMQQLSHAPEQVAGSTMLEQAGLVRSSAAAEYDIASAL